MFNLSTQDVVLSIEKSPLLVTQGIVYQEYQNFFDRNMIEQVTELSNLNMVPLENQIEKQRFRVDYQEQVMKRLDIFFRHASITKALEKKFETDLKYSSVDIWQDSPGYFLEPHTDDPRIKLALQIYLGDDNIGTSLYDNDNKSLKTFEYKFNCGYALLNTDISRHGPAGKVTDKVRNSIYVRYR